MNSKLENWKTSGSFINYSTFSHKVFVKEWGDIKGKPERTLLLLHGFPEASFSYHLVFEGLKTQFDRIILFDMIGYGFSDKPIINYSYSLLEQADLALKVWEHFGIKGGHLLSHDMGDSVATELVTRHVNGLLPGWFTAGFKSFTFTNGSMVLKLAELRITQKVLLSKFGFLMGRLVNFKLFSQQIRSAHGNGNLSEEIIQQLWELNTINNGHQKTYLTIKYLNDRKQFEKTRWLPALSQLETPIHLCWGSDDSVAKVEMAHHLKSNICPNAKLTIMKGLGHFCQLDNPKVWLDSILAFYL